MNKWTHFFIKIYLSHFMLERVDVGCVWETSWRRVQTVILTQSSSFGHSSTSSSSWLGCSTVGHWGPKALCDPRAPGYIIVSRSPAYPLFFRLFTQVYLLIDSSVEGQYVTQWSGYKYCYLTTNFLFNITHSFAQLNASKYYYVSQTIQLNISHLFTFS